MNKLTTALLRASIAGGVLFSGYISSAAAIDISVCPSGCDHNTIVTGLSAASSGDRVVVGTPGRVIPEIYYENVQMQNNIDLVSEGNNSTTTYTDPLGGTGHSTTVLRRTTLTVIHGAGTSAVVMFPFTMNTNTLLDGFIIENIDATALDWTGLVLIGGTSPTIQNNIIRDNRGPAHNGGITMTGIGGTTASPLIQNNVIHYMNGPGIGMQAASNPTILNNVIFTTPPDLEDFSPGIGLADTSTATIRDNEIFQNGRGGIGSVEFGVADTGIPIVITGNTIYGHSPWGGVRITGQSGSTNVQVQIGGPNPSDSNEFHSNMGGVRLDHHDSNGRMASALIQNNNFHHNSAGVRGENMTLLTIKDNIMNNQVEFCAVRAHNSNTIIIENNEMHNNKFCGIRIWHGNSAPYVEIRNNNISNSGIGGMRLDNAGMSGIVTGNHIYQNTRGGILILREMNLEISNNEINHNIRGGIHTGLDTAYNPLYPLSDGFFSAPGDAVLTIKSNKVHHNGQGAMGGGIDVRHASGSVTNNLVYKNHMGGIRYGEWMNTIENNTVVNNGQSGVGGGIAFDNLEGAVNQNPPQGSPNPALGIASIQNNIITSNTNAAVNAGTLYSGGATCPSHVGFRQYNLISLNNGIATSPCPTIGGPGSTTLAPYCVRPQLGMCDQNAGEIFAPPQFVNEAGENYSLAGGSPALTGGTGGSEMGAYGGPNGMTW